MPYSIEASVMRKRLTQNNWLNHLDEMMDGEIEYMLRTAPDAKRLKQELESDPIPVWRFAEELRDLF